jgi:hypothetical protein
MLSGIMWVFGAWVGARLQNSITTRQLLIALVLDRADVGCRVRL